jgi:hypothetical protein
MNKILFLLFLSATACSSTSYNKEQISNRLTPNEKQEYWLNGTQKFPCIELKGRGHDTCVPIKQK